MPYVNAARRRKSAVVHEGGDDKFPVDSSATAKSAVRLLNHAKPALSPSQKKAVLAQAAKYGVKPKTDVLHSDSKGAKKGAK